MSTSAASTLAATADGELTHKNPSKKTSNSPATQHASDDTTSIATSCTAAQAVFQTAELVENIISYLSPKNVFGVLRVSKAFNSTLKSATIQEKLFTRLKEPATGSRTRKWRYRENGEILFVATPSPFINILSQRSTRSSYTLHDVGLSGPKSRGKKATLLDPASSLLDTYFSDPPTRQVHIDVVFQIEHYKVGVKLRVRAQTWRQAIDEAMANKKYWVSKHNGRLDGWSSAWTDRWSICNRDGNVTMRAAISTLEKESGCKASLILTAKKTHSAKLHCELYGMGFAENKEWETNGEAPWQGSEEVQPSERVSSQGYSTEENSWLVERKPPPWWETGDEGFE